MWEEGVLEREKPKREAERVFSFRAAQKMPGSARKKGKVGGVSGGKGGETYWGRRGEREREGDGAEALPELRVDGCEA